jgi:CheY-like chemotaxis protein
MKMPVMDGWEFARVYRQVPGQHAPIVVVTAAADAAGRAAEVAADGHLPKPFDLDDLFRVIEQYAPAH